MTPTLPTLTPARQREEEREVGDRAPEPVMQGEMFEAELPAEPQEPALSRRISCQKQGSSDDFQTPPWALEMLLPYLKPHWTIWEPACGRGNIVRALRGAGLNVIPSDIREGRDFLIWQPPGWEFCDAIVTNPPYSLKDEFIARCYALGKPWALLVPYTVLEGRLRQRMYREYGVQVLLPEKRVDFETPSGGPSSAWFPSLWLTWGLNLPSDLMFSRPQQTGQISLALEFPTYLPGGRREGREEK